MNKNYFGIERDNQFPRFCLGCLIGKNESEMSERDTQYCVDCQPLIETEYGMVAEG